MLQDAAVFSCENHVYGMPLSFPVKMVQTPRLPPFFYSCGQQIQWLLSVSPFILHIFVVICFTSFRCVVLFHTTKHKSDDAGEIKCKYGRNKRNGG